MLRAMAGHDVAQCGDSLFCRDDGMAEAKPGAADVTRRAALPDKRNGKDATLVWLKARIIGDRRSPG